MKQTIDRAEAIQLLAAHELKSRDSEWRDDELFCIGASWGIGDYEGHPVSLRNEVKLHSSHEAEIQDSEHPRFDELLLNSIKGNFIGATNAYLASCLAEIGYPEYTVVGDNECLIPCPCCGLRSLGSRAYYEICSVCWWEDDGQDNNNAYLCAGGPNKYSLVNARINFLLHGISTPKRADLIQLQDSAEKYSVGRSFTIDRQEKRISEKNANWSAPFEEG